MVDATNLAEMAAEQESGQSGQSASAKGGRKSLEEQLAEIEAQKRKLQERIKQRDKELRAQYEKDLWVLLKAEKWDEVSIEVWQMAAKSISSALKSARREG
jgi:restriction endonuclease S subunit